MAIRIKASDLPAVTRGRGSGTPFVRISEAGQISFSTETSKKMGKHPWVDIGWDNEKRIMTFVPLDAAPKGVAETDLIKLGHSDKTGANYLAGSGLLRLNIPEKKLVIAYDFAKSGAQKFVPNVNEKGVVSITLPVEALTPVPKIEGKGRGKGKAKTAAAGASGGSNAGAGANGAAVADGIELEIAE